MDDGPLGPHWWDEFNTPTPTRQPVARTPRPRWPLILGSLLLIGLTVLISYPSFPPLTGN
jgi:hypothetical protein